MLETKEELKWKQRRGVKEDKGSRGDTGYYHNLVWIKSVVKPFSKHEATSTFHFKLSDSTKTLSEWLSERSGENQCVCVCVYARLTSQMAVDIRGRDSVFEIKCKMESN